MDSRELLAKAWGVTAYVPTPEHEEALAFAARLDALEQRIRGAVAADPLRVWDVSARLRQLADDLDALAETLEVPR